MHDCHEAMVKIKMAFSTANGQTKEVIVDLDPNKLDNLNVANFGELTEAYLLEDPQPFAIPFDLHALQTLPPEEWAIAEDQNQDSQNAATGNETRRAMDLTMESEDVFHNPPDQLEENEEWTAFDPDDDEDRHVFQDSHNDNDESKISDIEAVRAADDSIISDGQHLSVLGDEIVTRLSEQEFPLADSDNGFSNIPFDDKSQEEQPSRDSGLILNPDTSVERSNIDNSIAGLTVSPDEKPKKRTRKAGPRRMRKRRKVVIDNDDTQLSGEHIKAMLDDTSDIVLPGRVHPADWVEGDDATFSKRDLRKHLPYERLMVRPQVADDGALAPSLLQVWMKNTSQARGLGMSFHLRGKAGEEQRAQRKIKLDAKQEDLELGRHARESEDAEGRISVDGEIDFPVDQEEGFPLPEDGDDMPVPFDDDEHPLDVSVHAGEGARSPGSALELGLVNDFEEDLENDPRQEAGGDLISSDSKWHKHTVKVFSMLKNQLGQKEGGSAHELSYDMLSNGCSRHTAASVFFELLQLKTWDFIELDQADSYGNIAVSLLAGYATNDDIGELTDSSLLQITPGVRFNEESPAS